MNRHTSLIKLPLALIQYFLQAWMLLQIVKLWIQFMKNVIMTLYTELSISMCPFLLLITGKSRIINIQILRIFKKLFQCLIGTKHLRIKIQMKWLGYQLIHCVKSVQIRSYFWSECGKIRTRNYSVFGHFSRSDTLIFSKTSFRINL